MVDSVDEAEVSVEAVVVKDSEAEVSVEAVVVKDSEAEALVVVDTVTEVSVEAVSVRVEVNEVSVEMVEEAVSVSDTDTVDVSLAELAEVVSETAVDTVEVVEGRHGPALTPLAASRARVLARSRVETMITSERQGFKERQKRERQECGKQEAEQNRAWAMPLIHSFSRLSFSDPEVGPVRLSQHASN